MTPTWPPLDAKLLADSAATLNFRLGLPTPLAVTPDGAVLFRRTPPRAFAADLYELDTRTGAVKTLVTTAELLGAGEEQLSDAEKARRERTRTATRGIVDIDVSADGRIVMVPLGDRFHLIDRTTGQRRILDPKGSAFTPHLSPDGTQVAFVRDGDLWVLGTELRQLTHHPDGFEYGTAEFVAQEELGRRRGFWWAPDGTTIAFQRTDLRPVDTIYVADALHPERAPVPFKYPRAGRPNAIVDLGFVPAGGGEPRWLTWDTAKYPYLARFTWDAIVVLSREQQDLAVLTLDGKVLHTEHDDAWINLSGPAERIGPVGGAPVKGRDGGFWWMTEKSGSWTLTIFSGEATPTYMPVSYAELTLPSSVPKLRDLIGIDDDGALIVTAGADPTVQDIYRVPFDRTLPTRLTDGDGWSTGAFDHGVLVATTNLRAGGKRTVAITKTGRHELPSVAEQPSLVPTTAIETVELSGRTHYVAITRPRSFDPHRKYPVLLKVYGGPHVTVVDCARDNYVMDQWYADAGFIVVRSDNRGTPYRDRAWERAIHQDLATIPLEDQVGALKAVGARHGELDLSRVGIFGWSFGGYMAAMAVLRYPEVFKAAVAGAPVTDWTLYDTAYTERYMRTPEHNPDGYQRTSAMAYADKLSRPLLLVHGITDDNVHFAHTLALIQALYVAGKRAEVIALSATHMVPDPKLSFAREQVQIDFFRQHL